jgi:hypothetical protein
MMSERWKTIAGFAYEVSDMVRVRNSRTGRILKPRPNKSGHLTVMFCPGRDVDQTEGRAM